MGRPRELAFTYEDYLQLPEGDRRELIGGDFYVTPAPSPKHQRVIQQLNDVLRDHIERGRPRLGTVYLSPIDVVLSATDVVQPDLVYVSKTRARLVTERAIEGAPDLAVEVLSPSTQERDRTLKKRLYARAGVSELWLVDPPRRAVEVFTRGAQRYRLHGRFGPWDTATSALLPGLTFLVRDLFRE